MPRRKTREVSIGSVKVGGGAPVSIQSMTKCPTTDTQAVIAQIRSLATAGCEIVRLAVPDTHAANAIKTVKAVSPLPIVADIHFDYRLALLAINAGADAVRINPGNIQRDRDLRAVAEAARSRRIPIRIGVNSGSLKRSVLKKFGGPTADAMVYSALQAAEKFEAWGFADIILSLKSHDVSETVRAYRKVAALCDLPLHLGLTATGSGVEATIKSAIAVGSLLLEGIGDTLRVSLSASSLEEVQAAQIILRAVGLRPHGLQVIACPTCGRCKVDLLRYLSLVRKKLSGCDKELTVAVMGCVVNGPGEARLADIGVAFSDDGSASLFRRGKKLAAGPAEEMVNRLVQEVLL